MLVEAALAARLLGVLDDVRASLAGPNPDPTDALATSLDRTLRHGARRAEELREAAQMLRDLGIDPVMSQATALRQDALGAVGIDALGTTVELTLDAVGARSALPVSGGRS